MAGGVAQDRRSGRFYVWFNWDGQHKKFTKGLSGEPFYVEQQATRFLERIRGDIDRLKDRFDPSIYGMDKRILVENAWQTYTEESPCGVARRRQRDVIFERYILPYFKGKSIKSVHYLDLDEWLKSLVGASRASYSVTCAFVGNKPVSNWDRDERPGPPLSPSYLRNILVTFKHFFKFWYTREILDRVPGFPAVKVPMREIITLTEAEIDHVHEFIPVQHLSIFRYLKYSGCRPSEACNLLRTDVDWQKKEVTYRDSKTGTRSQKILPEMEETLVDGGVVGTHGQGSRIRELIGVNKASASQSDGVTEIKFQSGSNPDHPTNLFYVFSTVTGKPYRRQGLYATWKLANKLAHEKYGIKMVKLYEGTRKSCGTNLLNQGAPADVVQKWLGHSKIATTLIYYAEHRTQEAGDKVAKVMSLREKEK